MRTLARLARHPGDERTVRVVARYARDEGAMVERCWNWFRYITKQLDPNVYWGPDAGPFRPLRAILKVWPHRTALPVACAQMVGGSQDIWTKAQREAGFQSELQWGDPERIYYGDELDARRERERATLSLHPHDAAWLWRLEVANIGAAARPVDAILIQDLGLGDRGFVMNNEAYASQYIDHHIARHPRCGPVVMSRQNLAQDGRHPWVLHGCLDGASGFATDGMQLFGPPFRDSDAVSFAFGVGLPSEQLQFELACAAIQSAPVALAPGSSAAGRFFGLYDPDHAEASNDSDLARIDAVAWCDQSPIDTILAAPVRTLVQNAPPAVADPIDAEDLARRYPERQHEERLKGELLSFFTPEPAHNRHVVLKDKELLVTRRHGTLLRSGQAMLPDEAALCATCWMQGVFGAQLTIGNTSFHKLFSISRDPYNITHASGLRILIDPGDSWRLPTVPSAFEIGLSDCRWIYCFGMRTITVRAIASGEDPAMQWRVVVDGEPCKFLVFGHAILGERELENESLIEVEPDSKRFSFRPDPNWLWGQHYPNAVYHLVTSTPGAVEAIGGDELLYPDRQPRDGAYLALRTRPTHELCFAVAGSMTDAEAARRLAEKYQHGVEDKDLLAPAARRFNVSAAF